MPLTCCRPDVLRSKNGSGSILPDDLRINLGYFMRLSLSLFCKIAAIARDAEEDLRKTPAVARVTLFKIPHSIIALRSSLVSIMSALFKLEDGKSDACEKKIISCSQ